MKHSPSRPSPVQLCKYRLNLPDADWLRFDPAEDFGATAAALAQGHVSSPQAVAFLTQSLLLLNKDALHRGGTVIETFAWVPNRDTGEVKFYGHTGRGGFPNAEEATAQAYAGRDPQKDLGRKVVVYAHKATMLGCPAGQGVLSLWSQRHRGNALTELCAEVRVFPPIADCWEAWDLFLAGTDLDLAEQVGHFARFFAMDVKLTVRFPDGTTQDFPVRDTAPQGDA